MATAEGRRSAALQALGAALVGAGVFAIADHGLLGRTGRILLTESPWMTSAASTPHRVREGALLSKLGHDPGATAAYVGPAAIAHVVSAAQTLCGPAHLHTWTDHTARAMWMVSAALLVLFCASATRLARNVLGSSTGVLPLPTVAACALAGFSAHTGLPSLAASAGAVTGAAVLSQPDANLGAVLFASASAGALVVQGGLVTTAALAAPLPALAAMYAGEARAALAGSVAASGLAAGVAGGALASWTGSAAPALATVDPVLSLGWYASALLWARDARWFGTLTAAFPVAVSLAATVRYGRSTPLVAVVVAAGAAAVAGPGTCLADLALFLAALGPAMAAAPRRVPMAAFAGAAMAWAVMLAAAAQYAWEEMGIGNANYLFAASLTLAGAVMVLSLQTAGAFGPEAEGPAGRAARRGGPRRAGPGEDYHEKRL
ncbi:unnamed protein product [Pedinophyceae sp. YPF-701]|nr:unnamed protein product [Pedinophyceae sp. YPF-701]